MNRFEKVRKNRTSDPPYFAQNQSTSNLLPNTQKQSRYHNPLIMNDLAKNLSFQPFPPVRKPPKDCQTFGKSLPERYGETPSLSVPFEEFARSKVHLRAARAQSSLRPHAFFAPNESRFSLLFLQIAQKSEHDFRQVFLTSEYTDKRAVQLKIEKKVSMSCHRFHLLLVIKTKNDMKTGEFTSRIARLRPQMVAVARFKKK